MLSNSSKSEWIAVVTICEMTKKKSAKVRGDHNLHHNTQSTCTQKSEKKWVHQIMHSQLVLFRQKQTLTEDKNALQIHARHTFVVNMTKGKVTKNKQAQKKSREQTDTNWTLKLRLPFRLGKKNNRRKLQRGKCRIQS